MTRRLVDVNYTDAATAFKLVADPVRFGILIKLAEESKTVGELGGILELSPTTISWHLAMLRRAKVVAGTREGQRIRYTLSQAFVGKLGAYVAALT